MGVLFCFTCRFNFVIIILIVYCITVFCFCVRGKGTKRTLVNDPYSGDSFFELVRPSSLTYLYRIRPAQDFGILLNVTYFNIEFVPGEPLRGCSPLTNSHFISGNVALIERGDCSFLSKAVIAQDAGASAVIIMDNDYDNSQYLVDMIGDETGRAVNIASFFMRGKDGHMIYQRLKEMSIHSAVINLPVNGTLLAVRKHLSQPPWSVW